MKRNSELERIGDIIKTIAFGFDEDIEAKKQELMSKWGEAAGEKFLKYSTPVDIDDVGVMWIVCKNSVVSNELFSNRIEINKRLKSIANDLGIDFKYIRLTKQRN